MYIDEKNHNKCKIQLLAVVIFFQTKAKSKK